MATAAAPAVAGTAPAAEAPAAKRTPKPKNQAALQVPKFAQKLADDLGTQLDERTKHVIAAAILLFKEQPADVQVQAVYAARVKFRENAVTEDAAE
jgi:hypothetical protein